MLPQYFSSRLAVEGEPLVIHRFRDGSTGIVAGTDVKRDPPPRHSFWMRLMQRLRASSDPPFVAAVHVPNGAYIILKDIPSAIQQRYGIDEEEGAIVVTDSGHDILRFSNGSQLPIQALREGSPLEVLSLAFTRPVLYEPELQIR